MQLTWPFHNRRKEIVDRPFPEEWLPILSSNVKLYSLLTPDEQTRLRGDLRIFISEKNWEGVLDFEITDEVKVTVSALACLLTVGFERHDYFPNLESIIIYPTSYISTGQESVTGRIVQDRHQANLGEAHGLGPIVLSWADVLSGGQISDDGHNLVFHEFAHKLDFRDGEANGVPLLRDPAEIDDWARVMSAEYEQLVDDVDHNRHSVLRSYGATNPAEFFAVCTESFFEQSVNLRTKKPELYRVLKDYYGIDWAERMKQIS